MPPPGRARAQGENVSRDDPPDERVIYRERFQGVYFDFRGKSIFTRYDRCEFVKCTLLIDHATEQLAFTACVFTDCNIDKLQVANRAVRRTSGASDKAAIGTERFPLVATNVIHEGVTKNRGERPCQHSEVGSQLDHPNMTGKSSTFSWN
jgi:hypothetical protein